MADEGSGSGSTLAIPLLPSSEERINGSTFGALVSRIRELEGMVDAAYAVREDEATRTRIHTEDLVKAAKRLAEASSPVDKADTAEASTTADSEEQAQMSAEIEEKAERLTSQLVSAEKDAKATRAGFVRARDGPDPRSGFGLADALRLEEAGAAAARRAEEVWAAKAQRATLSLAEEAEKRQLAASAEQRAAMQAQTTRAELKLELAACERAEADAADAKERAAAAAKERSAAVEVEKSVAAQLEATEAAARQAAASLEAAESERDAALRAAKEAGHRAKVEGEAERARLAAETEKWMQAEAAVCARLEYAEDRLEAVLRSEKLAAAGDDWEAHSLRSAGDQKRKNMRDMSLGGDLSSSCPWPLQQSWPKGDKEKERRWARNHIRRVTTPE